MQSEPAPHSKKMLWAGGILSALPVLLLLFSASMKLIAATIDAVIAQGGELVQPIGADAPEITARFRDPAGNVMGLYQEPSRPSPAGEQ